MKIIKTVLIIIGIIVITFASFIIYTVFEDMNPEEKLDISISNNQVKEVPIEQELKITSYNIGYAGLDEGQDFFADGGKNSRAESEDRVRDNLQNIIEIIDDTESDIFLFQEVDKKSSRSYMVDQLEILKENYPNYAYAFALNYKVPWVPVPVVNPMGRVESGIASFSRYNIKEANRFQLPGKEKWIVQLFELDRCFVETRLPVNNGKELIVVNTHLSAFDKGGIIREQQLSYLQIYLEGEYKRGNYIIVGGDWNHNLPLTEPDKFTALEDWPFWLKNLPENYEVEKYNWELDLDSPTVRTLAKPYSDGYNFKAIIDGFLISDNVESISVKTTDTNFKYTDHNPTTLTFILK
ncbi:MAG: endonuclease/exonuclease/phosphatase family protein [Gudongella sp.]|nr:endonuclease/exonuclease/phosphatase family protein [Gudongella sp.]